MKLQYSDVSLAIVVNQQKASLIAGYARDDVLEYADLAGDRRGVRAGGP